MDSLVVPMRPSIGVYYVGPRSPLCLSVACYAVDSLRQYNRVPQFQQSEPTNFHNHEISYIDEEKRDSRLSLKGNAPFALLFHSTL